MEFARGALASSYLPAAKPVWSVAQRRVSVDATHQLSTVVERVIEFAEHAGCVAMLAKWDAKYFSEDPAVSPDGVLTFAASGCGGETTIDVAIFDVADVTPTGELARIGEASITIDVATRTMLKRPIKDATKRPTRVASVSPQAGLNRSSFGTSTPSPAGGEGSPARTSKAPAVMQSSSSAVLPPPRTTIQLPNDASTSAVLSSSSGVGLSATASGADLTGLSAPSIRVHRAAPPRATQRSFATYLLSVAPMLLMRQWNYHAEYALLSDARGTPEQAVLLLKKIQSAMEQGQVVESVVPLIDAACRLHVALGGVANLRTAVRLAHLRVQAVGTAVGIDMRAATPLEVSAAQRLTSARRETVELLIRVLVESAHLMKLTGAFPDALRYYRTAATIAATQNAAALSSGPGGGGGASSSGATQIPFIIAAADTHFLSGDLASAVRLYEEARAHAEVASRGGSVVAECEQQLAFVFSVTGQIKEAEIAARRALAIRREQGDTTATAEALLFEASGLAARGKVAQAAQSVIRARAEVKQAGERANFVRVVAEVLAGVLTTFADDCPELDWDATASEGCPDKVVASFARWLRVIHDASPSTWRLPDGRPSSEAIAEILDGIEPVIGTDALLANLLRLSLAVATTDADAAAASARAGAVVDSLTPRVAQLSPLVRLSVEIATVCATAADERTTALSHAERLVWLVTSDGAAPVSYNEAFRISAAVAEAAAGAPSVDRSSLPGVEAMYARLFEVAGAQEGHFSPKIVALLLDAAEVRHVKGDYSSALELFAKALRIVDAKNLLYLIGPLYLPTWMLSPPEARDRDRLCSERHPGNDGLTALAMVLQQLGLTHEAAGNVPKAVGALQQSVATFELARIGHHPGSLDALVNLGRCHLALREQATARVYLERADELFQDHFYDFGRYISTSPASVRLRAKIDAGLRACRVSEKAEGTLLCRGHPSNPVLEALQLYL